MTLVETRRRRRVRPSATAVKEDIPNTAFGPMYAREAAALEGRDDGRLEAAIAEIMAGYRSPA